MSAYKLINAIVIVSFHDPKICILQAMDLYDNNRLFQQQVKNNDYRKSKLANGGFRKLLLTIVCLFLVQLNSTIVGNFIVDFQSIN